MISLACHRHPLLKNLRWRILPRQQWLLTGPNGSGKTLLARLLAGELQLPRVSLDLADPPPTIALLTFAQQSLLSGDYLQARWHSAAESLPTVRAFLSYDNVHHINPYEIRPKNTAARKTFSARLKHLAATLDLSPLLPRPLIALSNGESRRVLLAHACLQTPDLLILDDPFAGLDPDASRHLRHILADLASHGQSMLLTLRHPDEIPAFITHTLNLETPKTAPWQSPTSATPRTSKTASSRGNAHPLPPPENSIVISIRNLTLHFGRRTLFKNLSWKIRQGQHWLLTGPNGSGKSTLFALIRGDHPAAHAHDITLLGHTLHNSVWKIRKHIAFVSPELQATLAASDPAFAALSSGQQRLRLLDHVFKGRPKILLLDEPCLNLDPAHTRAFYDRLTHYLSAHPLVTALLITHHPVEAPATFTHRLKLTGQQTRR